DVQNPYTCGHRRAEGVARRGKRNGGFVCRGGRAEAGSAYPAWWRWHHPDSCRSMRPKGILSYSASPRDDEYASSSVVWKRVVGRGAQKNAHCFLSKSAVRRSGREQTVF